MGTEGFAPPTGGFFKFLEPPSFLLAYAPANKPE